MFYIKPFLISKTSSNSNIYANNLKICGYKNMYFNIPKHFNIIIFLKKNKATFSIPKPLTVRLIRLTQASSRACTSKLLQVCSALVKAFSFNNLYYFLSQLF